MDGDNDNRRLRKMEANDDAIASDITSELGDTDAENDRDEWMTPGGRVTTAESVVSFASSTGSSVRQRRLPPPPPGIIKRPRVSDAESPGQFGGMERTAHLQDDQMSVVSTNTINDAVPPVNHRALEEERKKVRYIRHDSDRYFMSYDSLLLGRSIEAQQSDAYVDTTYCSRSLLEELMNLKYKVRQVGTSDFRDVQKRASDHGDGCMFYNSDGAIFANIDAVFKHCITHPQDINGEPLICANELLYVAEIEGSPGGGMEYVLTRKLWEAKVYGFMSLQREEARYDLKGQAHYPPESLEQWKGHSCDRGNGDIMNPEFVNKFAAHIRKTTEKGVHVVLANGGINTETVDEDRKELLIKNIAAAEAVIALKCLRDGGTLILKLYDMFTSYTVGLLYLLYICFEKTTIYRPESCRYGSAERYVICLGFKSSPLSKGVMNYLENCLATEFVSKARAIDEKAEIMTLVSPDILRDAAHFYDYIYTSNQEIGQKQLKETKDIIRALSCDKEAEFISTLRSKILTKCRNEWGLPNELRQEAKYSDLSETDTARKLMKPYVDNEIIQAERTGEVELSYETMNEDLLSPKQWHYVHVGRDRGFYLSKGGNVVFRFYEGTWKRINDELELAANTLVYGDVVDEISQYEGKQIVKVAFHIIDGLVLGGKDIRNMPYMERNEWCEKFAASMNKIMADRLMLVRAKCPMLLNTIGDSFRAVHKKQILGRGDMKKKPLVPVERAKYNNVVPEYALTGYLFLKTSRPNNSACDFICTMQNRIYFVLKDNSNLDPHGTVPLLPENLRRTRVEAAALVHHLQRGGGQK